MTSQSTRRGQRVFTKDYWRNVQMRTVNKLPYNINGLCAYSLQAGNRMALLEKCTDGRPWKHDSMSNGATTTVYATRTVVEDLCVRT